MIDEAAHPAIGRRQREWERTGRTARKAVVMQSQPEMTLAGPAWPRPHRFPAGLASCVVHVVLLVLLGWWYRPPAPRGLPDHDRPGGIVLAQVTPEDRIEYVDPAEAFDGPPLSAEASSQPIGGETPPPEAGGGPALPEVAGTDGAQPSVEIGSVEARSGGAFALAAPKRGGGPARGEIRLPRRFQGPTAGLSLFGSGRAVGHSFVFLIDRSKSMGEEGYGALRRAKGELLRALANLDQRHKFQVIAYHHERTYLTDEKRLLPATQDAKARVGPFFDHLAAFGGTNHELALVAALHLKPDVVFLLTDGDSPGLSPAEQDTIVGMARRMGTTIHCIQFGPPGTPPESFMPELAHRTGGSYRYVPKTR